MNDAATLELLYHDHHGWLLGWLRRRLGCPQHAADLAQDTFTRLLHAQRRDIGFDALTLREPRAFLTTTATRLLIDDARRRAIERSYLEALSVQSEFAFAPPPETLVMVVETLSGIARLLDGLPERPRTAFLMYRLEGLKQNEIAQRLGVSPTRVKQYVAQVMMHCYAVEHGA
jgi:RNA polymerase sigma-70 factor (ECF subfamily)